MSNCVSIDIPSPSYTVFDSKRDGMPEVISVNAALLGFAYITVFPWHLRITLEAQELANNGMPSPKENNLLFRIGDEIEAAVLSGRNEHGAENALPLARSTWNECRELLFQVHNPDITHEALQALLSSRSWEREWDYHMEADAEWKNASFVFQLFPQAHGHDA